MKTDDSDVSEGSQGEFTAGVLRNIVQRELVAGALTSSRIYAPSFSPSAKIDMNTFAFLLAIQQAGVPLLRIAFSIALLLAVGAGVFIYRQRDQLFGRDPEVMNDTSVVRHNRVEEIVFVLGGLTLAVLSVLYELSFG
jgi:hypothetical protein